MSFTAQRTPELRRVLCGREVGQYVATSGEWQARFDRVTITDRLNVSACHVVLYCTLHFHSHSFPLFIFYFIPLLRTKAMQMEGWADYLHTSLNGEHALFPALRLTSFGSFVTAAVLSASICLAERCVLVWSGRVGLSFAPLQGTNKAWLLTHVAPPQLPDICTYATLDTLSSRPPVACAQCALAGRPLFPSDVLKAVRTQSSSSDVALPAKPQSTDSTCYFQ